MQFCAIASGFQPCRDLLRSSQKTKAAPPLLCERSAWRCGWLCRSLIVQATGGREKGMAVSLQDTPREGRIGVSLPPYAVSRSPSFSFFFTLSTLNWQLAGKWMRCEVSPLKCRVLLLRQQRSSMRDICCSVVRIHLVTCLPSPCSFSMALPPLPLNIHSVSWGLSLSFSPLLFNSILLQITPLLTPPHPCLLLSFATIIPRPTSSLACCFYLNSLELADNPRVLPICSKMC